MITPEKKVGLFLVLTLVLGAVLFELGGRFLPFRHEPTYTTVLSSAVGLKDGDPVRVAGVDVGRITGIKLRGGMVAVKFQVTEQVQLHRGAAASIRLTNLLGGQFLALTPGDQAAQVLPDGAEVPGQDTASIDVIIDNVAGLAQETRAMVRSIDGNQQRLFSTASAMLQENREPLAAALKGAASVIGKTDRGEGTLGQLLNDPALYRQALLASQRVAQAAGALQQKDNTLGLLLQDPALYQQSLQAMRDAGAAAKSAQSILARIDRGEGTAGKLVQDDVLYRDLAASAANVRTITGQVASGKGTLGKLVQEDGLYRDAAAAVKKVERAADGLSDSGPLSILGSIIGTLF